MPKQDLAQMKQAQAARAANLAAWRMQRKHEITLPSGLMVVVRDVSMTDLMFTGRLPDSMLDFAQEAAQAVQNGTSEKDALQMIDLKELVKSGQDLKVLSEELVKICLVEPKIGDVADDSHITLDELNGDDRMFIFNWANREVEQVSSFRAGQNEPASTL